MKCPKCGYLGFETSDRCRNCGYDFSLAVDLGPPADELMLRSSAGGGEPLADFDLGEPDIDRTGDDLARFDLDRVIGEDQPGAPGAPGEPGAQSAAGAPDAPSARSARSALSAPSAPGAPGTLPLFGGDDDTSLITVPRPVLPPLSVRRTTPEIPRARQRPARPAVPPSDGELAFHIDGEPEPVAPTSAAGVRDHTLTPASAVARLGAAVIDLVLLGLIDAVVVYLTLALAGVAWQRYATLPLAPLVGFLAMLNGGYLIVFIAAGGQTIGKMMTGLRVVGDDGQRVDVGGAVLRAAGCAASLLTLGLGYLPAFVAADRRALQDRISGTRVVRAQ